MCEAKINDEVETHTHTHTNTLIQTPTGLTSCLLSFATFPFALVPVMKGIYTRAHGVLIA